MTEADILIIKQSFETSEWQDIKPLEDQAESKQCKRILHNRKMQLYHREEQLADQL